MDDVGSFFGGTVLGFVLCSILIFGLMIRGCGIVPIDVKIIQRERAIKEGIAHYHPTKRDSVVYDDKRVRFVVEGAK